MPKKRKTRKRILVITHKYFPENSPRAFRWRSIVREWTKVGISVDIVCGPQPGAKQNEILDGARIFRVRPWFYKSSVILKNRQKPEDVHLAVKTASPLPSHEPEGSNSSVLRLIRVFRRYLDRTAKNLTWPDRAMHWILPTFAFIKRTLSLQNYDAVFTVSWPESSHAVGYLLKLNSKSVQLTWIVDIGDPFSLNELTPPNNYRIYRKWNQSLERAILKTCSIITVTTEAVKRRYSEHFKIAREKIVVIPPMLTFDLGEKKPNYVKSSKIRLVFSGSLRKNNRRPDSLLALFSTLLEGKLANRLELHFWGDVKQCLDSFMNFDSLLSTKIFLHGIVSKKIIDRALNEADFLVNIGNKTHDQVPSKIADYMGLNKPIINISQHEKDSSWEHLVLFPLAINVLITEPYRFDPKIIQAITDFLLDPPRKLSKDLIFKLIRPYSSLTISERYLTLL